MRISLRATTAIGLLTGLAVTVAANASSLGTAPDTASVTRKVNARFVETTYADLILKPVTSAAAGALTKVTSAQAEVRWAHDSRSHQAELRRRPDWFGLRLVNDSANADRLAWVGIWRPQTSAASSCDHVVAMDANSGEVFLSKAACAS